MTWWKKKLPLAGTVLFRGELPPKPEEFAFLEQMGVSVSSSQNAPGALWCLKLAHPDWGSADLLCDENHPIPSKEFFDYTFMPQADRDAAASARSGVVLTMESRCEHILRDRKLMLRFLRAVMGTDGVVAMDHTAQKVWTRDALDDELVHDADLDVEGIFNLQAITDDSGNAYWVHTHGLSAIGGFDFDIFEPSEESTSGIWDLARALAFHILEGSIGPSTPKFQLMYPRGDIRLVEMDYFLEHTDPALREKIASDLDEEHRKNHSVICEPEGSFLGRMFAGKALQPVRFLTRELPENPMFSFSTAATELMAERARKTYPVLRSLHQEFGKYPFPCMVKLGIQTDSGDDREHMWFEVNDLYDDAIDATLINQPYGVSSIKEGDRRKHSIDLITDWGIMTPAGMITPRSTEAARILRANPEALIKLLEAVQRETDK